MQFSRERALCLIFGDLIVYSINSIQYKPISGKFKWHEVYVI